MESNYPYMEHKKLLRHFKALLFTNNHLAKLYNSNRLPTSTNWFAALEERKVYIKEVENEIVRRMESCVTTISE